ncbi:MAG TPA: hypothetical protein VGD11_03150 [Mycobacteriales bacterium]
MTTTRTEQERTAPDCGGYVAIDHAHGGAVSVTPYRVPAPRESTENRQGPVPPPPA